MTLCADEPDTSSVSAYWEDDTLSAAINTSSEVYVIEVSTYTLTQHFNSRFPGKLDSHSPVSKTCRVIIDTIQLDFSQSSSLCLH